MFIASDFIRKNIIINDVDNKEIECINNKYDEYVILILDKHHF